MLIYILFQCSVKYEINNFHTLVQEKYVHLHYDIIISSFFPAHILQEDKKSFLPVFFLFFPLSNGLSSFLLHHITHWASPECHITWIARLGRKVGEDSDVLIQLMPMTLTSPNNRLVLSCFWLFKPLSL